MNTRSRRSPFLAVSLLFGSLVLAQNQPPATPQPRMEFCSISWSEAGPPIGFQVNLRGSIADAGLAHRYEVRYQLRVHTQKDAMGPLLGDSQQPNGRATALGEAAAPDANGACAFAFDFDLTRKDLSAMTQLQKGQMVLRVEPQVYDLTAKAFITAPKSDALIAVIQVENRNRVWDVRPFAQWFTGCYSESGAKPALEMLASLDAIDAEGNAMVRAFEEVFANQDIKPAQLVLFVQALPVKDLALGKNNLRRCMDFLVEHKDEAVRAAAVDKQKQAEAMRAERQ